MHYSKKLLDKVKGENDIVTIVSEYVSLTKKGKYLFGSCPFHKGEEQSFSVTPEKQIFYCFSCKKGGNVYNFVMGIKNISYLEAFEYLADKSGINKKNANADEKQFKLNKDLIIQINKIAARFYYSQLTDTCHIKVQQLLLGNGISLNTIKKFGLGYSLNRWDSLYKFLLTKGYSDMDIELSGLVSRNTKGNLYDIFRNRIMFPLFDIEGELTGFCGIDISASQAQYLYTPESDVFSKKNTPFGLNIARKSTTKKLFVFENIFDAIKANQYGIDKSIALPHTFIDAKLFDNLKKHCNEIIIVYRANTLGIDEVLAKFKMLCENGYAIKIIEIPCEKTIDHFFNDNEELSYNHIEDAARSLLDFKLNNYFKNRSDNGAKEDTIAILNRIIDIITEYGNDLECEVNSLFYSSLYNVSYDAFFSEVKKRQKNLILISRKKKTKS